MSASSGRIGRATRRALDEELRRSGERIGVGGAQRAALRAGATAVDVALASGSSEAITRANRGYLEQLRAACLVVDPDELGGGAGADAAASEDAEWLALVRGLTAAAVGDVAVPGSADAGPGVGGGL